MTSTNKPAPREFWIDEKRYAFDKPFDPSYNKKEIHVIEMTAYLDLKEKLGVAKTALEFYADRENWNIVEPTGPSYRMRVSDVDRVDNFAGRRAREALEKMEGNE